jgi:SAM-dependent methyltransferase
MEAILLTKSNVSHWSQIANDPNCKEVAQWRREKLIAAREPRVIADRIQYLSELAKDHDVLDVGVVSHTREAISGPDWLHSHLCKSARSCLGVDILADEVSYLKGLGFNVVHADLTKDSLPESFSLIVMGEVLEHLSNPAQFLSNVSSMLRPQARLVLSVPNPWYINIIMKTLRNGAPYVDSADHVAWYDPCTLCELGERCGLKLNKFAGIASRSTGTLKSRLLFAAKPFFSAVGLRAEIFSKSMLYEFIRVE